MNEFTSTTLTNLRRDAVEMPSLALRVTEPGAAPKKYVLGLDTLVVGSGGDSDILVVDKSVSRRHCAFRITSRGIELTDLGSKNGTFVERVSVLSARVLPGNLVRIGDTEITIEVTGKPADVSLSSNVRFGQVLGGSIVMRALFARLEAAAASNETVLLFGESGTGKELLARAIHDKSARASGPFVVVDCGAIAKGLVESELFGFAKGAFTGADRDHAGLFEQANGGTLFIDEIGELPIDQQPKLLRALESRTVRRVGTNDQIPIDVRVVAATHRDLLSQMREQAFREDLYYRLAVIVANVPPLRDREGDIELLIERFLSDMHPPKYLRDIPAQTLAMLTSYTWPGNVRELKNAVARLALFPDDPLQDGVTGENEAVNVHTLPLKEARDLVVERFEMSYIEKKLAAAGGNVSKAAAEMGVSRQFLHRLIERYGIVR